MLVLVVNNIVCICNFYYFFKGFDLRNSIIINNKFVIIVRVNQRVYEGEFSDLLVVRLLIDSSFIQNVIVFIYRNKQENIGVLFRQIVEITDFIFSLFYFYQVGFRRLVYDGVQYIDFIFFVEGFFRYQFYKYYRKIFNREEQDNFKKEKFYSFCLKESLV